MRRLTDSIADCECPHEHHGDNESDGFYFEASCFADAKGKPVVESSLGEERRATLDEIAELVKECPACSALCVLIRERMDARKKWGVAKRKVRHAGKRLEAA